MEVFLSIVPLNKKPRFQLKPRLDSNPPKAEIRSTKFETNLNSKNTKDQNSASMIKVVVITAHASIESTVEAVRRSATDYLPKRFTPDQVRFITRRNGKLRELETEIASLR